MPYANLLIETAAGIRTITINRPDKLNALNRDTVTELRAAFEQAATDPRVRVIVLAGSGAKAFVAGADIAELAKLTPVECLEFSRYGQDTDAAGRALTASRSSQRSRALPSAAGLELAMCLPPAHRLRERAKIGQPEINLGVIPGFGGTQRLLRLSGRSAALELCLLGHHISAQRAYELGAITRVVPADQLDAEVQKIAEQLAASAPQAIRGTLDAVLIGGEAHIEAGLDYESQAFAICAATADMREGTSAFLERRKPVFRGQ
jgi:enoyl-CoA hydratase